jgi:hypothetical protein
MRVLLLAALVVVVSGVDPTDDSPQPLGEDSTDKDPKIVAAAVKQVHQEDAAAEEAAANEALSHHRVANAVHTVWHGEDLNAMYNEEMRGKHWHCKHCHQQCKTIRCRAWCHEKFCGMHYEKMLKAKSGIGRVGMVPGQPVIPQYAQAVESANYALYAAEKATTDEDFRKAARGLEKVDSESREDLDHFGNQQAYADAMDAAAYPDEKEKAANDKKLYEMEKTETQQSVELANQDAKESNSEAGSNNAFSDTKGATEEADKAMGGGDNLMNDIQGDIAAEDDTLAADDDDSSKPTMTAASNVEAELESVSVKVKAAAAEASDAAGDEEQAVRDKN